MAAPVQPNQILETVASIDGDFCEKFVGSLQAPALFAAWFKTVFKADGAFTDEFIAMVCAATSGTGGDPTGEPTEPPVVVPPVIPPQQPALPNLLPPSLTASRGELATVIRLNWTASPEAQSYRIYRGAELINQVSGLTYNDFVGTNKAYVYYVQAVKLPTQTSPYSNPAYGYTSPTGNPGTQPPRQ